MAEENQEETIILPHHEQQKLCTTRLPYRQGRKLTAVKVYTVNDESNHLLVFGVPSLKLRKEAKSQFAKFGKLLQFAITTKYPTEPFTENYHAIFEKIQSARLAKKVLDTKNFYGGSLHVCYAPELEDITETREKILQRQRDVMYRLRNLQKEEATKKKEDQQNTTKTKEDVVFLEHKKLNMGEVNVIGVGKQIRDVVLHKNKRKKVKQNSVKDKRLKPSVSTNKKDNTHVSINNDNEINKDTNNTNAKDNNSNGEEIEIIDFTSVDTDAITNINESLNYNKFGNEIIKKIPEKPVNKIKFNIGNKR